MFTLLTGDTLDWKSIPLKQGLLTHIVRQADVEDATED